MFARRLASLARTAVPSVARVSHNQNVMRPIVTSSVLRSARVFQHKDTPDNNIATGFEFNEENLKKIDILLAKYPPAYKRSAVIPILHLAQEQNDGWVSLAAMNKIARILEINPMRVFEVATFYTMFNQTPIGKHHVQVCTTTPCMVCGAYDILKVVEDHLGIKVGESTPDGMFHLSEAECLGACVNAPMMQVAGPLCEDSYYEDLTPEITVKLLEMIKRGERPPRGSQIGRMNSLGIQGKTSLKGEPAGPFCRDLDAC